MCRKRRPFLCLSCYPCLFPSRRWSYQLYSTAGWYWHDFHVEYRVLVEFRSCQLGASFRGQSIHICLAHNAYLLSAINYFVQVFPTRTRAIGTAAATYVTSDII